MCVRPGVPHSSPCMDREDVSVWLKFWGKELGRQGCAARGLAGGGLSEEHREKSGMCM